MAHLSENARRLPVSEELSGVDAGGAVVWLHQIGWSADDAEPDVDRLLAFLRPRLASLAEGSVLALLASPLTAARLWPSLSEAMSFRTWVAVRLEQPVDAGANRLPVEHNALLLCVKGTGPLVHTKTRVAYTFCPACDKTTKDYGGKKHTYHPYGTLLSDVWRDVTCAADGGAGAVVDRLRDFFGCDPYRSLVVTSEPAAAATRPPASPAAAAPRKGNDVASRLVCDDVLSALGEIGSDSIDFCFADPPYNIDKKYDVWSDALPAKQYDDWCAQWLDELARVVRPGGTVAVLNIPALAIKHFGQLSKRLSFQNWIAWDGLSLPVRLLMPAHYAVVCFSKGPARPVNRQEHLLSGQSDLTALVSGYCLRARCVASRAAAGMRDRVPVTDLWLDIHRLKHNSRRVDHPCQLPPALMRRLIATFTDEGDVVLDPFDGAGTTSLCAAMLRRRYVGVEMSPQYHEIALRRHRQLAGGEDPFGKMAGVPTAKNSRVRRARQARYEVPKKVLQLDVKRIASELKRLPTREEVMARSRYRIELFDDYFLSWAEACAAARNGGMSESRLPAGDVRSSGGANRCCSTTEGGEEAAFGVRRPSVVGRRPRQAALGPGSVVAGRCSYSGSLSSLGAEPASGRAAAFLAAAAL